MEKIKNAFSFIVSFVLCPLTARDLKIWRTVILLPVIIPMAVYILIKESFTKTDSKK
jgi:ABC-type sugar transport system permease subunit